MKTIDFISPAYLDEQRKLHGGPKAYGERGYKWAPVVLQLLQIFDCTSVLDYGCGQGSLARTLKDSDTLGVRISEYDPAIKGKDGLPSFADLVVCTDVAEHVERDRIDAVLRHLRLLARKAVFIVIATVDTEHKLSDGRSAHLTVKSGEWWHARCSSIGFTVGPPPDIARKRDHKEWAAVLLP